MPKCLSGSRILSLAAGFQISRFSDSYRLLAMLQETWQIEIVLPVTYWPVYAPLRSQALP